MTSTRTRTPFDEGWANKPAELKTGQMLMYGPDLLILARITWNKTKGKATDSSVHFQVPMKQDTLFRVHLVEDLTMKDASTISE